MIVRVADKMGAHIPTLIPFGKGLRSDMGQTRGAQSGEADRHAVWLTANNLEPRLSPFDPWRFAAYHALTLSHFHRGRYQEAADSAYKAVQANPGHSISQMLLAASLVKLRRIKEAKTAAARVLELQPAFRYGNQFTGVHCAADLAASIGEALSETGLAK